jgi:hypothetical protein
LSEADISNICRDYPDVAKKVIKEMHRQVGDLVFNEAGTGRFLVFSSLH